MKDYVTSPKRVVYLKDIKPLAGISGDASSGVTLGAGTTLAQVIESAAVKAAYPALWQSTLEVGTPQIRNMATVGGNLLQRTRCGYFTDVTRPCNKRVPGSGCPAVEGEHRNHAILGASENCVAVHPSDMAVALVAFGAVVHFETADGSGEAPLADFYLPVGDTPHRETALPPGALITGVVLPPVPVAANSRYRKVRERASYAFAIGSLAAALDVRDGVVRDARLAFGAVASRPWRALAAERVLIGAAADAETYAAAADAELAAARPLPHNGYKVTLMRNLVVAELTRLAQEAAR
jgi:xanthine dehydrogenase YagS FAD-binding subunit